MRATARKRKPFMTLKRWLLLITAFLLLLLTVSFIYFREVQSPEWTAINAAKEQATKAADLMEIEKVHHHIWQKNSWVVEGINQQDEHVYVWLTEEQQPVIMKATEGISEKSLKDNFISKRPLAEIKRIQPGLLDDKTVWEIYYNDGEKPDHYRYDFYRFDDGAFIDSYTLPAKTGP
ncbi:DUF5590 domain-containing protein [Paenibacillus sp. MCAF9]